MPGAAFDIVYDPSPDRGIVAATRDPFRSAGRLLWLLVQAAIEHAARNGARLVEACPMLKAKQSKSIGLFVGSVSVFAKAGFETVAERKDGRPLMRKVLR